MVSGAAYMSLCWVRVAGRGVCVWRGGPGGRLPVVLVLCAGTGWGRCLMLGVVPMMLSAWVCVCSECVACARG